MWFARHPAVKAELEKEIIEEQLPARVVDESIFLNGTFEELTSVKNWINEMVDRELSKVFIRDNLSALKRVCRGEFRGWGINLVTEGKWCLKHPDRLTLKEFRELNRELRSRKIDTHSLRMPLRDFLTSKGLVVGKKISGGKAKGFAKYADMKVEPERLERMIEEMKALNYQAFLIDRFMYATGTRINATLGILLKDIKRKQNFAKVKVFDKCRKSLLKGEEIERNGKKWIKFIPLSLYQELMKFAEGKALNEKVFSISSREMAKLNRYLITKYCPDIIQKYGKRIMWNHFWRHMFAQTMLTKTGWNYTVVAFMGGWDVKSLQESYGKPEEQQLEEWGVNIISEGLLESGLKTL